MGSVIAAPFLFTSIAIAQTTNWITPDDVLSNKLPGAFVKPAPELVRWSGTQAVLRHYKADTSRNETTVDPLTGEQILGQEKKTAEAVERKVLLRNNTIYLVEGNSQKAITTDAAKKNNPMLSPDGKWVAFTRNNDLYTLEVSSGKELRHTTDGSDVILNGYASWVYWEEIFGRPTQFRAFWWSPDSKHLAFMRFDQSMVPMFPIYNAKGQHGNLEETRYPKSGDENPVVRLGFTHPEGGNVLWANMANGHDHQLGWPKWHPESESLYVQYQNRRQDSLVMYAVKTDGTKAVVYTEHQSTWISLDEADERITFLKGGREMLIKTDKGGYNQYHRYTSDGKWLNAVSAEGHNVTDVLTLNEKTNQLFYAARPLRNSARQQLYSVALSGGKPRLLTDSNYHHTSYSLSPREEYLFTAYSNSSTPRSTQIVQVKTGRAIQLGTTTYAASYKLPETELIRITSADGKYALPALVTLPLNYEKGKRYPMLVNVYGGPDATQVMDTYSWSALKQLYAQEGIVQVTFDNRSSGHFGKAGVNEIFRQLGIKEIEDFSHMAKYFINAGIADPERICMTGFSYGGYMSCMAVTYASDVFTHAMAGGSVVDWHLYDTQYTERFMNRPQDNRSGYDTTTVMNYVDRYKGGLLLVHGTMDDNVHMQNSIQLVAALQDAGKEFEMMLYPEGRHGWGNLPARNRHFNKLKMKFVFENLLRKPFDW